MQSLLEHYEAAKKWISNSVYAEELRWQESLLLTNLEESSFLREYAWVVLNSGFRESVVRRRFDFISLCFCDWESAEAITSRRSVCVDTALPVFQNRRKLEAIASTAAIIHQQGFERFAISLRCNPADALRSLPYIGEVTCWHLAKNIGADVAKPDRHLVRLAQRFGYKDVLSMCKDISAIVGDRVSVTDLVLWRFEERTFSGRAIVSSL